MGSTDQELVRRVLRGDRDAFGLLVERYKSMVYGVAYAYLRNFHDAQDLSQEVFIKAYLNLKSYDPSKPFGNWLYTIAKRTAIDRLRARKAEEKLTEPIADPSPGPADEVERREMELMLREALTKLSEPLREAVCLYYVDGYSIKEISRTLSVPEGTVKRRLYEARKILRDEVIKMMEEGFRREALSWRFTRDVVAKVSSLKTALLNLIPEEFKHLVSMSDEELKSRRNELLRSLAEALSVSLEGLKPGEEISIPVSELTREQREFLWKALHELELMELIGMLRRGSAFMPLIEGFQSMEVRFGLYNAPHLESVHNRPYIRFVRSNPDGSQHSIQMGSWDA